MTDPLGLFAQPVGTFSPEGAIAELRRLQAEHGLAGIVIGWPLGDDGEEGPAVARVRPFANRLRRTFPGVPIYEQDERSTSRRAAAALVEAGVRRKARHKQTGRVDAAAATLILQDFLDEQGG